jgi:hypothetical protein
MARGGTCETADPRLVIERSRVRIPPRAPKPQVTRHAGIADYAEGNRRSFLWVRTSRRRRDRPRFATSECRPPPDWGGLGRWTKESRWECERPPQSGGRSWAARFDAATPPFPHFYKRVSHSYPYLPGRAMKIVLHRRSRASASMRWLAADPGERLDGLSRARWGPRRRTAGAQCRRERRSRTPRVGRTR